MICLFSQKSKSDEKAMNTAYFCWNELIDAFSCNPRRVTPKLIELLLRPLGVHLSEKCPHLKLEVRVVFAIVD